MAVTSYHAPTGRLLTSLGKDATPGSEHTLSIGHPLLGGEFTTYRLGAVVAHGGFFNEPLFDLKEADIKVENAFYPYREIVALLEDRKICLDREIVLGGRTYRRTGWGHYALKIAA